MATGYAAGSTDAGVNLEGDPKDWANSPQLVENFRKLSALINFYLIKPKRRSTEEELNKRNSS